MSLEAELPRIQEQILRLVEEEKLEEADALTRKIAQRAYLEEVKHWSLNKKIAFIEQVTGGLGFRQHDVTDVDRMVHVGSYIAWADAVRNGYVVFEVGTGLGRTLYVITSRANVKLYVTCDVNPYILAIALFENPVSEFQEALWKSQVRILLCDCVRLSYRMKLTFDHVVHDGGPCPDANPRIYSEHFLRRLLDLCRCGGTLSVFAGRNPKWVSRIYMFYKSQPDVKEVVTVAVPASTVKVIHVVKK